MPSLLTKTAVACSECNKPLSGGRDTFGTFELPLCIDCRFSTEAKYIQSQREKLIELRDEYKEKDRQIGELERESDDLLRRISDLEGDQCDAESEINKLEKSLGLTPGQEVAL